MKKGLTALVAGLVVLMATAAVGVVDNEEKAIEITGMGYCSDGISVTYENVGNGTAFVENVTVLHKKVVIDQHSLELPAGVSATFSYPAELEDNGRITVSLDGVYPKRPLCYGPEKCPASKKPAA